MVWETVIFRRRVSGTTTESRTTVRADVGSIRDVPHDTGGGGPTLPSTAYLTTVRVDGNRLQHTSR